MKGKNNMKKIILSAAALFAAAAVTVCAAIYYLPPSDKRLEDRYGGTIETYKSSFDCDNDGIDDQTDILNGALDYIKTRPKYKSIYYDGGFPDDNHGVCTDVIGFAMLSAGYDLMELVNRDIIEHPDDYDVDKPDKNIDFRRVRNLNVYFSHTAVTLTNDINDIDEWQGGDIVVFKKHIGLVSDRRNKNGVPYVIHHYGVWQTRYEEDILEKRGDVIGHYRVSE